MRDSQGPGAGLTNSAISNNYLKYSLAKSQKSDLELSLSKSRMRSELANAQAVEYSLTKSGLQNETDALKDLISVEDLEPKDQPAIVNDEPLIEQHQTSTWKASPSKNRLFGLVEDW